MDALRDELLSEDFLKKLERLRLLAGKTLVGPKKGEHPSWRSGTGLEFLDHRRYQPGDDIRYMDWNVYGRLDKLFLKLFRSEEDLTVHFLLDCSRSMGTGNPSKMLYACKTAAALGYLALAHADQVGLVAFSDTLKEAPPLYKGRKAYLSLVRFLTSLTTEGETRISPCLREFAIQAPRSGWVFILSDFLDEQGPEIGLQALRQRKFRIALIHILNPEELHPPWGGFLSFKDVETGERKKITITADLLKGYEKKMEAFLTRIQRLCPVYGVRYFLLETNRPFEDFIVGGILPSGLFR